MRLARLALCCAAAGAIILCSAVPTAVAQDLLAYGRHLSGECTVCHKADGQDQGIPSITGWEVEVFVDTMNFYRQGLRDNPAMRSVAESLDDRQVRALATYFSSLPKPKSGSANQ